MRCFYTNVHSMKNKQEELEIILWEQNYDLVITGVLQWIATNCSEGRCKGEEVIYNRKD